MGQYIGMQPGMGETQGPSQGGALSPRDRRRMSEGGNPVAIGPDGQPQPGQTGTPPNPGQSSMPGGPPYANGVPDPNAPPNMPPNMGGVPPGGPPNQPQFPT